MKKLAVYAAVITAIMCLPSVSFAVNYGRIKVMLPSMDYKILVDNIPIDLIENNRAIIRVAAGWHDLLLRTKDGVRVFSRSVRVNMDEVSTVDIKSELANPKKEGVVW